MEDKTFFVETTIFQKQEGRKTPFYHTWPVIAFKVCKRGGLEKCGQDMIFFKILKFKLQDSALSYKSQVEDDWQLSLCDNKKDLEDVTFFC